MKDYLLAKLKSYRSRLSDFFDTYTGQQVLKVGSYFFQALVIGIILYQLTDIGWNRIWKALPTEPLFYLLFLFIYFLLPLSETFAYKICWGISYFKSIPIFIKKRIFNKDVMGYSGELVLMHWAVSSNNLTNKQAFKDIRDMNIISSAASTFVALGLLLVLVLTGQIRAIDYLFNAQYFAGTGIAEYLIGAILLSLFVLIAYRFRKYLFSMSLVVSAKIFLIHFVRMIFLYSAQILQWHIVLPDLSLEIWFTFLSVNIVISRIPFLPSQEFVATGTNIEVAKVIGAPVASVTGLFIVHNVLDKMLNLVMYLYYTWSSTPEMELKNKLPDNKQL